MAFSPSINTQAMAQIVRQAWDRSPYYALRSQPMFEAVADIKPALQAMPGNVVTWTLLDNLAPATLPLSEQSDITPVSATTSQVSVSVQEYGNAVLLDAAIRATGFIDIDEASMNLIGYNLVDSLDLVALAQLQNGVNVRFANGKTSRATLTANTQSGSFDSITPGDLRFILAKLRGNKAAPKKNSLYCAFIHPDASADLRQTTGSFAGWRDAHVYASPQAIFAGEIGAFEGFAFIETPRAPILLSAGAVNPGTSNNVAVYQTILCGEQALAKATAIDAHIVSSPVIDSLRRNMGFGWYTLEGWGRFREAALYRLESTSAFSSSN